MFLEKEDVSLYYEVRGDGDALILIHGVMVDAGLFEKTAQLLSRFYRVITYDRRGNSRSVLKCRKDFSMDDQAADILDLMEQLGIGSACFVGASAGAAVGQHFLSRYPEKVRHLIMYEPALLGHMSGQPDVREWIAKMQDMIGRKRYNSALLAFANHIASFDTRSPQKSPEQSMREMSNCRYALTEEFPGMIAYRPDIGILRRNARKITLAAGEKSEGTIYYRGALELAREIGTEAVFYPGYHNLPYDLPREFAVNVLGTLRFAEKEQAG
ncbi:MAG: alpha/beta hydrolase [Lachnospiraceae bacterium]|nr:alpha/beta hydrolase [Lachnospiraceae bacterium]